MVDVEGLRVGHINETRHPISLNNTPHSPARERKDSISMNDAGGFDEN